MGARDYLSRDGGILMPTAQLNFSNDQRSGDEQLAGAAPFAYNVVIDGTGTVKRRPAMSAWATADTPSFGVITGIASLGEHISVVNENTGLGTRQVTVLGSDRAMVPGSGGALPVGTRPTFAETQFRLVLATGAAPYAVDPAGALALLGGSPPSSTQVAALASRLMTDDLTSSTTAGRIRYSGPGNAGNQTWNALGFVTAEARPDAIVALRENSNELFAFGETTLQVFSPDASVILAPGRALNRGCAAPHSVIRVDEQFAWLDERRQFVISDGRSIETISDPLSAVFDAMETVSDCWGFRCDMDQYDLLVWTFPTDGRTFAYQRGAGWSQWTSWLDESGHIAIALTAHHYLSAENTHLVGVAVPGMADTGLLGQLEVGRTDITASGRIMCSVATGFQNHGTDAVKFTDSLKLVFRRETSVAAGPSVPHIRVSWRDDMGDFCTPRRVSFNSVGSYGFTAELRTLGRYRSRQWKIEFDSSLADLVLARVTEDFTVGVN